MTRQVYSGVGATPRAGVGTVVWYDGDAALPDPPDSVDADAELARFATARGRARDELEAERDRTRDRIGEEEAAVFDAHLQFLDDPQLVDPVEERIEGGLAAPHAVVEGFDEPIARFESMEGRMAERADDLRDVRDRLVRILTDGERVNLSTLPEGTVLLAERLTPSDTAQLDPERVAGFATVEGGRTSHAAIFARSLAIPAVVGVGESLRHVDDEATVLVDGDEGELLVDPDEEDRDRVRESDAVAVRRDPVSTADGRPVEVAANVGTLAELEPAARSGADGIGLFRTEFLFVDRDEPPTEDEQVDAYRQALRTFPEGRVVVRTLDVGGDKPIPYLEQPDSENPFLGERGIRRSLGPDADLFETQLRALLRAAATLDGGDLAVMFPMVATVRELDAALDAVTEVAADLAEEGVDHARPELGVMVETPAASLVADHLASRVDFLSIGTNDLTQYVVAAARDDDRVTDLHDPTDPAVLRAISRTVEAGHAHGAWVGMCGEMAGDPAYTELLVGLGLDELSMSAVTVPDVKASVEGTDSGNAESLAERALNASTRNEVRDLL
ncbi:phosphoenolpyruvate--protein phosphotransferase [Haloarchaeobius sp. HRN-SO-5]|uniref:phosphoenolpyruvate--protein phosphotransferase n=1 Tax=Haloarchaeobius sp. HRN-SO-5 TaxID=3446118 RepID=UPI003EBE0DF5